MGLTGSGILPASTFHRPNRSFRKDGYFIGSGVVEVGCKTVVGKRTKQSGTFWRVYGAQNILNIRCSVISETYDLYWQARRQAQIQALKLAA
jgi:hypothetical protein